MTFKFVNMLVVFIDILQLTRLGFIPRVTETILAEERILESYVSYGIITPTVSLMSSHLILLLQEPNKLYIEYYSTSELKVYVRTWSLNFWHNHPA